MQKLAPLVAGTSAKSRTCTVEAYDKGHWRLKERPPKLMLTGNDVLEAMGSPGLTCPWLGEAAAGLGVKDWSDPKDPGFAALTEKMGYEYTAECRLEERGPVQQLQYLIDNGGLLFIGDSVMRQQFAFYGCQLGDSVKHLATFDSDHELSNTQDYYLNPDSKLFKELVIPPGFDVKDTPVASYKRTDMFVTKQEILDAVRKARPHSTANWNTTQKFDAFFDLGPSDYLELMHDPTRRYSTLIAATGAHWVPGHFNATSMDEVLYHFDLAMDYWATQMTERLLPHQRALVRANGPGWYGCEAHLHPLQHVQPLTDGVWNWKQMSTMNDLLEKQVRSRKSRKLTWLGGERMTRLRPDGHNSWDCLHWNIASGVPEVWNKSMWHALLTS